jgi:hypothetical protein
VPGGARRGRRPARTASRKLPKVVWSLWSSDYLHVLAYTT